MIGDWLFVQRSVGMQPALQQARECELLLCSGFFSKVICLAMIRRNGDFCFWHCRAEF